VSALATLHLDENVDPRVGAILRSRGFTVTNTLEAGLIAARDDVQLAFAVSRHAVIITHNRCHFEELALQYAEQKRLYAGIIVTPVGRPNIVAGRLLRVLGARSATEFENQITYV
jgi:hypothetical protein